jgi:hypothetical protein
MLDLAGFLNAINDRLDLPSAAIISVSPYLLEKCAMYLFRFHNRKRPIRLKWDIG